jgi:predicted MPP superfamily phosphohydrolase
METTELEGNLRFAVLDYRSGGKVASTLNRLALLQTAPLSAKIRGIHGQPLSGIAMKRRTFLRIVGSSLVTVGGLGYYAWRIEPHWLELVRRPLTIHGLTPSLAGRTLVHLSDIHVGMVVDDPYLKGAFQRVAALKPEIVVITGDLITWHPNILTHMREVLADVPRGRHATLAVLGNHDYGPRWSDPDAADGVIEGAAQCGITVLRNEMRDVQGLQIVGLDDFWARRFQLRAGLSDLVPSQPALVLSHNPDTVDQPGWDDYHGWILAGHTHGGQCRPPFLAPPLLSVRNRRYTSGRFALSGGRTLYISRGLGYLHRVRFNVRPEVTVFEMCQA